MLITQSASMSGTLITTEINVESNIHEHHFLTERTSIVVRKEFFLSRQMIKTPDGNRGILHDSGISVKYNEL